jgi:Ca2+-dependent lipid-binding protein
LPKVDGLLGSIDPYIIFEFNGLSVKSKYASDSQNPTFNQKLTLPFLEPTLTEYLNLKVIFYIFYHYIYKFI